MNLGKRAGFVTAIVMLFGLASMGCGKDAAAACHNLCAKASRCGATSDQVNTCNSACDLVNWNNCKNASDIADCFNSCAGTDCTQSCDCQQNITCQP